MFHGDASTDLDEVEQAVPVGGEVSELNVRVSDPPRGGEWEFQLVEDGVLTGVKCTISSGSTSCSDTVNSELYDAGDLLALSADPDFSPKGGVHVRWTALLSGQ